MADARPLLIAYDGSEFAKAAIAEAGRELQSGRRAVVLTIREPLEQVPFMSTLGTSVDARTFAALQESGAQEATAVAEEGAELARAAGFEAEARIETAPTPWERIVDIGEELDAGLIVVGSRGLTGLKRAVIGSVAAAVAQHSGRSVLIVHS